MDYGAAIRDRLPTAWRGDEFEPLLTELEGYLPEEDIAGILAIGIIGLSPDGVHIR